jgi:hypothetical protein
LERVISLMRTDDSEDPPPHVVARAVRLFRSRTAQAHSPSMPRRLVALLRFDSAQSPLAMGVRAGGQVGRQMLYVAEAHELEVRAVLSGRAWTLAGQVLGPSGAGSVELRGAGDSVQAMLNEQCEFRLPPVPAGSYSMTVRFSDVEIEVPRLVLPS